MFVTMMSIGCQLMAELDIQTKRYDVQIRECTAGSQMNRRLMRVPDLSPLTLCLFVATVGKGGDFGPAHVVAA